MKLNAIQAAAVTASVFIGAVGAQAMTIEMVPVGDVGNPADVTGYGAVGYGYQIGKYEVTNTQYVAFLNAVAATDTFDLYNTGMGTQQFGGITRSGSPGSFTYMAKSGFENKTVNYVSFWDATRFVNWLSNGRGGASTETGSYTLTSDGISGNTVTRNGGATWAVASENEWYKAAYYDPTKNSGAGGYWLNAAQNDTLANNTDFAATNGANYYDEDYANGGFSGPGTMDVDTYANADSYYGSFDQSSNLWEWNKAVLYGLIRGVLGGWWNYSEGYLRSSSQGPTEDAMNEYSSLGFRVVSLAAIPESSATTVLLGIGALASAAA